MGLHGDLSTLDLAGIFQNLEGARKNGVLTIQDGRRATRLCFRAGLLRALTYPDRPDLGGLLSAAGVVDAAALERARRKRGASLADALAEAGLVDRATLIAWVRERVTDEASELLMTRSGRFEFHEGLGPEGMFDADEMALALDLAAGPLLLEAARRSDHWKMIRERVPSDGLHYELALQPKEAKSESAAALQARVLELLDGTRSVGEIAAFFPHRRFEFYELIAGLAAARAIRPCDPNDVSRRVRALSSRDPARALELLERGLESDPRNLALLMSKAVLAESTGQLESASEALKLVVHLELERGGVRDARAALEKLKQIDEDDPFVWERSFELALGEKRTADATADARTLVALYRRPGLHRKARGVIERLIAAAGETWERVQELAQLCAESGDVPGGVQVLERFGRARLGEDAYTLARRAYQEILTLDPHAQGAQATLDEIDNGVLERKRARWRKLRLRLLLALGAAVLVPWIGYEALARRAYLDVTREMLRQDWTSPGRERFAVEEFRAVGERYHWSTMAQFEVPAMLAELEALARRNALADRAE
jgi:tetratricopeptide (TPR) repeat protein